MGYRCNAQDDRVDLFFVCLVPVKQVVPAGLLVEVDILDRQQTDPPDVPGLNATIATLAAMVTGGELVVRKSDRGGKMSCGAKYEYKLSRQLHCVTVLVKPLLE